MMSIADILITSGYAGCLMAVVLCRNDREALMRRRQFLVVLTGLASCVSVGCGTMLHRERVGQPHTNHIDWKIAALDGLGLLLFFVPGVIAFVVDFQTGAIYLPPEEVAGAKPATPPEGQLHQVAMRQITLPREEMSPERIESLVASETGRAVTLSDSNARVSSLKTLDDYRPQRRRHEADRTFGSGLRAFFAKLGAKDAQK